MGKDLKGRECGKGICQRTDGLYVARFVSKQGCRKAKCFPYRADAQSWLEDTKYADKHGAPFAQPDMTADEWFSFWIKNIVGDLAPNTLRNYRTRYERNMKPILGDMKLESVSRCIAKWF